MGKCASACSKLHISMRTYNTSKTKASRSYSRKPLSLRPIVQIWGIKLLFRFFDALWPDAHADEKENTRVIARRSLESVVVAMAKQPSEDGESVEVGRMGESGRRLMRRIGA
jgi:hypothetical protein